MQLVGRDTETAALTAALAAAGERPLVVLRGEAGIGKTRLVGFVRDESARRRFSLLAGTATERERDVPGALFDQAGTSPADDSRTARWQGLLAAVDALAGARPSVVLLDDVHWADPTSLELLDLLVRRAPPPPHALVVSARPGPEVDGVLLAARAVGRPTTVLDLAPLDRVAATALLADVPDVQRDRLVELAAGNPLFLEELARSAATDGVPRGIVAAVTAELDRLDGAAARLVRAGALLGDPFDLGLASRTAGLELRTALDAVDLLVRRGIVRGASDLGGFSFRHPLVRSAVCASMSYADLATGHAAAARELAAIDAPLPQQARHVAVTAAAGDDAAAHLLRGAAHQVRSSAPSIAADWLIASRRAAPGTQTALLAECLVRSGRLDEALEIADEGLGGAGSDPDLVLVAARVERLRGRQEDSRRRLARALADHPDPRLDAALAVTAYELGDYDDVARWARGAGGSDDPVVVGAAAALTAMGQRFGGLRPEAEAAADRAVAAFRGATGPELAAHADLLTGATWALVAVERLDDALALGRRTSEATRRTGNDAAALPLLLAEVLALGLLGRIAEADAAADRAEVAARLLHNEQSVQWALWMHAWVLLERDEPESARLAAAESVDLATRLDDSSLATVARTVLGSTLLALGRPQEAEPLLAAYDVDPGWICRWAPRLVEARLALDDRPAAAQAVARATDLAARSGLAGALAAARRARSLLDRDADAALEAIAYAESIGAQLEVAQGHLLAGQALVGSDRETAVGHLTEAVRLADLAGARRTAAEATRELRRLGRRVGRGGTRGVPGAGVEALSRRERDVGLLVAEGLTNRQIAERLYLSEKTVEAHLSRAFAKLEVTSRAALAAQIVSAPRSSGSR